MSNEPKLLFDKDWTWHKCREALRSEVAHGLAITPRVLLVSLPEWLSKHFFALVRMVAAGAILFLIAAPAAEVGRDVLRPTNTLVSLAVTESTYSVASTEKGSRDTTESEKKWPMHEVKHEDSAAPQVWAYGIRAAGALGILALSLWAILALLREE